MFFPNHQGLYDVLAIIEVCPRPVLCGDEKRSSKCTVLKTGICLYESHPLDRNDLRQGLQVIKQVAEEVKKGRNYLIFAEGTRSRKGNQLLDFKGGSFKSAVKAQCPIVPVALIDSYKSFDTNSIKKLTVQVHFLEPIPYEEYQGMKTTEIAAMVKGRIEDTIRQYEGNTAET